MVKKSGNAVVLTLVVAAVGLGATVTSGCGGDSRRRVKTPSDRLAEQEELAYRQELEELESGTASSSRTDEPVTTFDLADVELQLKQAALSAETCPGVVTEEGQPLGKTAVTLRFARDGSIEVLSIPAPFEGTRMGDCVLNAFGQVRTAPYTGEVQAVSWDITLQR